jgi:hypothetical protein
MKTKLLTMVLLAAASLSAAVRIGIGVGVGVPAYYPPAPPVVTYAQPVYPSPAIVAAPPYAGAYWVAPHYFGGRYYAGYWGRGHVRGFRR